MICPRCGGSNIVIEGCEIYCLSEGNSIITRKCLYHFDAIERRSFKRWIKTFASEVFGWKKTTCVNNVKLIEEMFLPENAEITEEDQKDARRELNTMSNTKSMRGRRNLNQDYYQKNKEKASEYYKGYYQRNKEKIKENNREKAAQYRKDNPEKVKKAVERWREKNQVRYTEYQKEYRAKKL